MLRLSIDLVSLERPRHRVRSSFPWPAARFCFLSAALAIAPVSCSDGLDARALSPGACCSSSAQAPHKEKSALETPLRTAARRACWCPLRGSRWGPWSATRC